MVMVGETRDGDGIEKQGMVMVGETRDGDGRRNKGW